MALPQAFPRASAPASPIIASGMTLRSLMDARRSEGRRLSLVEAIAIAVPTCLDLQDRHARGERVYVHPSAIAASADGLARVQTELAVPPEHPLDKHCLAPEMRRVAEPGDACASVFSLGAILYEMVTGQHVGPAMRRPRDFDSALPEAFEVLIGKAIVGDRAHRPADLGALASAMYHLAPQRSIHPPEIDEGRLDQSAQLDFDVKFSLLPPSTNNGAFATPKTAVGPSPRGPELPHARLNALKVRLESDPRPRYVVIKDRMDHGPFTAVELLQQIASHAFIAEDELRDEMGGQQVPIGQWEEFAPFAVQARLLREKRAEQKEVIVAAQADRTLGLAKTILGVFVVLALAGALSVWVFTRRGTRTDNVVVAKDRTGTVEVNGDIRGKKHHATGAVGAAGGGYASGTSYEAILNGYSQEITMGQAAGAPDLTDAQLSAPLRYASFVTSCRAPDSMKVTVRVAVRMGHAIGVTVSTNPPNQGIAQCIDHAVRGLRWPENAKTDFVTTNY
jgi:eukaryotic-like serine/threonine-protein kinase